MSQEAGVAIPVPIIPVDPIEATLNDKSNYLPADKWFLELQDDGIDLTVAELELWSKKPKKKKTVHITHHVKHCKQVYDVPKKFFNLYNDKSDTLFSKILKNSSDCITQIGKYIADKQYSTKRGDMHAHTESELKEFAAMDKHQHLTTIHFISQRDVLKFSLEKWSGKQWPIQ